MSISLRNNIRHVGRIPDWTLEESGAIVAADLWDEDIKEDLEDERKRFWAIEQWLYHYRFDEPLPNKLIESDYSTYIPFADFSNARLELAQRLFNKSHQAQKLFASGGHLWTIVETSEFLGSSAIRGLGEKLKIPELRRKCLGITKTNWSRRFQGKGAKHDNYLSMVKIVVPNWFEQEAEKIAEDDSYFREYHSDYLRAKNRFWRTMKENKEYQITNHLSDGTTHRTGKGKQLPQSHGKSQGFGKKHYKEM